MITVATTKGRALGLKPSLASTYRAGGARSNEESAPAHQSMAVGSRAPLAIAFHVAWMTAAPSTSANAVPVTGQPYGRPGGRVNFRIMSRSLFLRDRRSFRALFASAD